MQADVVAAGAPTAGLEARRHYVMLRTRREPEDGRRLPGETEEAPAT